MQTTTLTAIATATLNRVESGRRLKAQCGLADDTLRVEIKFMEQYKPQWADAVVRNGEGAYEVYISPRVSSCSCKDHEYRGTLCKHIAAAAMFLLGTTTPTAKPCPFALGDLVQLRGLSARQGKVVCVSHETISVSWPMHGLKPAFTAAYNMVELEGATPMPSTCRECRQAKCECEVNNILTALLRTKLRELKVMTDSSKYEWYNGEPLFMGEPFENRVTEQEEEAIRQVRESTRPMPATRATIGENSPMPSTPKYQQPYQVKVTRPAPSLWQDTYRFTAATYQDAVNVARGYYQQYKRATALYHDPGTYCWFSITTSGAEEDCNRTHPLPEIARHAA